MASKHGDEDFIYAIANEQNDGAGEETPNDITNGYAHFRGERVEFSERCVVEDWLYVTIPTDFALMTKEAAELKYPDINRPHFIYTNEDGSTNITFTFTEDKLADDKVEEARDFLAKTISDLNPARKTTKSGVIEAGVKIGYFDFMSPALGCVIYNKMFVFPVDGQFVLGCFNCLEFDKAAWADVAEQMIASVRVPE